MTVCARCGHENPKGFRFCGACAAPLDPSRAPSPVRKTVTVVFCDIVGWTTLGERLDPEILRGVMTRYFDRMQSVLQRHGGTVEKFIGDAVMAVFGIPRLHEDDALRAIRAAWEMREALAALNEQLEREYRVRLEFRIGLNTGPVVAGDVEAGGALVTGDTVNVAARLEQAAPLGQILLGEATYGFVSEQVRAEPVDPLTLHGKSEPVVAWRLLELVAAAPTQTRLTETPFVARTGELAALERSLAEALESRMPRLCTVVGPPGIGKTRLIRELVAEKGDGARTLVGRCLPYGEGITFWPLAEIVRQLTGGETGRIGELVEDESEGLVTERISGALGAAEPTSEPEETFWAFRKLFETLAHERPLIVVVDDIQWAEPTLLDLLEYVVTFTTDAPILVLCGARPELLEARPSWAAPQPGTALVTLEPLSEEESAVLIERLPGGPLLSEELRSRIVAAAEGNPLFVEQMLVLRSEDGGAGREIQVPPSIQALLAARIDRLEHGDRAVIERASVEGRRFHRGAVADLLGQEARPSLGGRLMSLIRRGFIRPDRALFLGDDAFRFSHLLVRDAAYEAMSKQLRSELHEGFAVWLERRAGDRLAEYEEVLGYHLEQAFRLREQLGRVGDRERTLASRAGARLGAAGRRALARGDLPAAVNLLSRAVSVLPRDEHDRAELLPELASALSHHGDLTGAQSVAWEAIEAATAAGDRGLEWRARIRHVSARLASDPSSTRDDVIPVAEGALTAFRELGDEGGLAEAWTLLSGVHWAACRWGAHADALERALVHAQGARDHAAEAAILSWLTASLYYGPTPADEGLRRVKRILEEAREHRWVEASALRVLGLFHAMQGDFDEARSLCAQAQSILEDLGQMYRLAGGWQMTSRVETLVGDAATAEHQLRKGYSLLEEMGETVLLSTTAGYLAQAVEAQGRHEEAGKLAQTCRRLASPDDVLSHVLWRGVEARLLVRRGSAAKAEPLARDAVELIDTTEDPNSQADARWVLADVLRAQGRHDDAVGALEEAIRLYELKGNVVMVRRAEARLGALLGPQVELT